MENASRALVIAGGVLLSLIIIGVVMFAYRGITSLQKEKDISLSNEQVSKINEQIEKYTKKSVIYGSEVLSICNAIEDYSESEGYQMITAKIKIKANGANNVELFFKDEYNDEEYNDEQYNSTQRLKGDYDSAIKTRDDKGKISMSNGKTIEELYDLFKTDSQKINSYYDLYLNGGKYNIEEILQFLEEYEKYKNCINTFREKEFRASVVYSNTTGIIKEIVIQPK